MLSNKITSKASNKILSISNKISQLQRNLAKGESKDKNLLKQIKSLQNFRNRCVKKICTDFNVFNIGQPILVYNLNTESTVEVIVVDIVYYQSTSSIAYKLSKDGIPFEWNDKIHKSVTKPIVSQKPVSANPK